MSKILVVDSDAEEREVARRSLCGASYEVVLVHTPDDVAGIVLVEAAELIVLAVDFPGLASFELYRRLRRDVLVSTIPIILLSEKNDMGECVRGLEMGAEDCISKPINPMELVLRTRKILRRPIQPEFFLQLIVCPWELPSGVEATRRLSATCC